MITDPIRVLLIEDDPDGVLLLKESFKEASLVNIKLAHADRLSSGLVRLAGQGQDVILLDLNLPDSRGLETLGIVIKEFPEIPVVVLSSLADDLTAIEAVRQGAQDYLVKGELNGSLLGRVLRYAIERKRAEEALRKREEQYRMLFEGNPHPMWVYEMDSLAFLAVNDAAVARYAYSRDEFLNMTIKDIRPEEDIPRLLEKVTTGREGYDESGNWRHRVKNGTIIDVEIITHTLEYEGKQAKLVVAHDITKRKQAEQARKESQARLSSVINSAMDAILSVDDKQCIVLFNPAAEKMFGCTAEEAMGQSIERFLPSRYRAAHQRHISNFGETGETNRTMRNLMTIFGLRASGEEFPIEASISHAESSGQHLYTAILRDITERKQVEARLRKLNRTYNLLSDVSQTIVRVHEPQMLFDAACRIAVEQGGFCMAWIGLLDQQTKQVRPAAYAGKTNGYLEKLNITRDDSERGRGPTATALRSGKSVVVNDIASDLRMMPWRSDALRLGYRASTAFPIRVAGEVRGTLNLYASEPDFFDGEELRLLEEMVAGIAFALEFTEQEEQRRRAEVTLRESEERLRSVIEQSPVGIAFSRDGVTVDANRVYLHMFGYDNMEELRGRSLLEQIAPQCRTEILDRVKRRAQGQEIESSYETTGLRKDGSQFPFMVSVNRIMLPDGNPMTISFFLDITERKRAEEKIQRQLQRLNGLRAIDAAISSSFDIRVTLDIVLQQVVVQLGVDAAAILLFNPHTQTIEYAASQGFHSNVLHHTQLKLSEGYAGRAIREHRTVYTPDLLKAGGKLAEAMQLAKEDFVDYYGTPLIAKEEIKGVLEIYHRSPLISDPEWLDLLETLAGQAAIAIDNAQLFDSLQRSNAELEKRVAERTTELHRMNIELEHANRAKNEFLATMSHELRTPLNSILGLAESLQEQRRDPLSDHQQKSLQIIESSGRHLLELINDILDLSKIEAGKFDYFPQIIAVDELCQASLAFVREQVIRKFITVTYQEEMAVSKIYADPRRLKQILVNLLTNAVKFTPNHGRVSLQVRANAEQDRIQFSVIDNGIGIVLEDLRQLFIPFAQVDSSLTREYEGTGLGLALVQKLTDLHGGSVDVESELGKGSRFTINLPLGKAMVVDHEVIESDGKLLINKQVERTSKLIEESVSRGTILLAEDNMANILTIGDYLESHGYQIVVAHDGLEAIEKAEEINPNIILMDIQMPVMDGLKAMRRLRADIRFASTPIIVLTALAMPGDRERCLEAGANEYLSKPVGLKALVKAISQLLSQKE